MSWIVTHLWLIAALPILAGGVISVTKQPHRRLAATLAIGAMSVSLLLAVTAMLHVVSSGQSKSSMLHGFSMGRSGSGSDGFWIR